VELLGIALILLVVLIVIVVAALAFARAASRADEQTERLAALGEIGDQPFGELSPLDALAEEITRRTAAGVDPRTDDRRDSATKRFKQRSWPRRIKNQLY
jgi:hypothetical protein